MTPDVTVIVATHNRPEILPTALRSALSQSRSALEILVIGDRCDARTERAVRSLDDPRISYGNLGLRVGEQSGPNSVGMTLARAPTLAFLNHDDVWLDDHLEIALDALDREDADLFVGRSAIAKRCAADGMPLFSGISPAGRSPADCFDGGFRFFEPCSAWVVRTEAARRVGPWRGALSLYRTPLEDWILRAWYGGLRFAMGEPLTVLKIDTHNARAAAGKVYGLPSAEHSLMAAGLLEGTPTQIRRRVLREVEAHDDGESGKRQVLRTRNPLERMLYRVLVNRASRALCRRTGLDGVELYGWLTRKETGATLRTALHRRTGEALGSAADVDALLGSLSMIVDRRDVTCAAGSPIAAARSSVRTGPPPPP